MQISIYSIAKNKDEIAIDEYIKMSQKYAKINDVILFNNKIAKAQGRGRNASLESYDEIYADKLNGFCIGLDERGKLLDSYEFADLLKDRSEISFFIGGAYGLSDEFKSKMGEVISFSRLTLAHKVAKLVLYEQIFRGLCIKAGHPYHK
ncbi:MAG: 23S rRNA (pseudouridine(1915)-N(3))-methyltransferase RlmH [Campylobacter sp.]|nr:23S rRNA (pseudouridine(1915)-N(3))-methyltransferase RlmH [Campylobacter sp.]